MDQNQPNQDFNHQDSQIEQTDSQNPGQPVNESGCNQNASAPQSQLPPEKPRSGLAIASMVIGILSIVSLCFCCCSDFSVIVPIVLGIIGIVLAFLSRENGKMNGMAKSGLICSIIGLVIGVISLVVVIFLLINSESIMNWLREVYESQGMEFPY